MSSNYTASVTLNATDNASKVIQAVLAEVLKLQAAINGTNGGVPIISKTTNDYRNLGTQITNVTRQTAQSKGGFDALTGSLWKFGAAYISVQRLGSLFAASIEDGVKFNSLMETSRLGIAATINTFRTYVDERGRALPIEEQYIRSQQQAVFVQELLRKEAFRSTATMSELTESYMRLQGAAGTQNATSQQLVRFIGTLSNWAKTLGMNLNEASNQMQMVLQGVARTSGRVGAFIRSLGISNQQLRAWRDAGTLVENLEKRMQMFMRLGPDLNKTWEGVMSNLNDVAEQGSAAFMRPWMDAFKEMGQAFINSVTYVEGEGPDEEERGIKPDVLKKVSTVGLMGAVRLEAALAPAADALRTILELVSGIPKSVKDTFRDLAEFGILTLSLVSGIVEGFVLTVRKAIAAVPVALQKFVEGVADISGSATLRGWSEQMKGMYDPVWGKAYSKLWDDVVARAEGGIARLDAIWNKGPAEDKGNGDPNKNDRAKAVANLNEAWKNLVAEVRAGEGIAALDGVAKKIAEIGRQAAETKQKFDAFVASAYKDQNLPTGAAAEKEKQARIEKALTDSYTENSIQQTLKKGWESFKRILASGVKFEKETIEDRVAAFRQGLQDQIDAKERAARQEVLKTDATEAQIAAAKEEWMKAADRQAVAFREKEGARERERIQRAEEQSRRDGLEMNERFTHEQGAWAAHAAALYQIYRDKGMAPIQASMKAFAQDAKDQLEAAISPESGWNAAIAMISARTETDGQNIASTWMEIWGSISRGFEDSFYNVLTGGIRDVGDIFKGVANDILRSWSRMITGMVQNWIKGSRAIEDANVGFGGAIGSPLSGDWGPGGVQNVAKATGTGGKGLGGILSVLGLLGGAYGIGSAFAGSRGGGRAIGSYGGAAAGLIATAGLGVGLTGAAAGGFLGGGSAGAIAGSAVPIIGTIIGAIVGALIGSLLSKRSEIKVPVGGGLTMGVGRAGSMTELDGQILAKRDSYVAAMLNMGRTSKQGAGFASSASDYLNSYLMGHPFLVKAGSADDVQKDIDRLLGSIMPKEMIRALFGQTVTKYLGTTNGIDGIAEWASGSFDANAPIPKMLAGLGVTSDKIKQIAQSIDIRDPEKFMEWLSGFVEVVSGLKRLTGTDVQAEATKRFNQTEAEAINSVFDDLKTGWQDLALLSGDEKIARGKELIAQTDEYFEAQIQYLLKLKQLQKQINDSTDSLMEKYRNVGETRDQRLGRLEDKKIWPLWGKLDQATTPERVQELVAEGQAAATEILDILIAKLNEARAIAEDLGEVKGLFGDFGREPLEGMRKVREDVNTLFADIGRSATLSGDEQLEALRKVGQNARDLYGTLSQTLAAIRQNAKDLTASIQKQVWGIDYDAQDKSGKVGMIESRMAEILASLKTANSPEEIRALTDEYQSLVSTYLGLFDPNDPRLAQAREDAKKGLRLLNERAQEVYAQMGDEVKSFAMSIFKKLDGPISDTATAIGNLEKEVDRWIGFLDNLRTKANEKLNALGNDLTKKNGELIAEMEKTRQGFVSLNNTLTGGGGGGGGGGGNGKPANEQIADFAATTGDAEGAVRRFQRALDAVSDSLGAPATEGDQIPNPRDGETGASDYKMTLAVVRRWNGATVPRTY